MTIITTTKALPTKFHCSKLSSFTRALTLPMSVNSVLNCSAYVLHVLHPLFEEKIKQKKGNWISTTNSMRDMGLLYLHASTRPLPASPPYVCLWNSGVRYLQSYRHHTRELREYWEKDAMYRWKSDSVKTASCWLSWNQKLILGTGTDNETVWKSCHGGIITTEACGATFRGRRLHLQLMLLQFFSGLITF